MTEVSADLLSACASEPIRIPGAIQPHGAMIVIDPQSLTILHASANLQAVTGLVATGMLSANSNADHLVTEVRRWIASGDPVLLRVIEVGGRRLEVTGHLAPQGAMLEFEVPSAAGEHVLEGMYPRLRHFLDALSTADDVKAIARATVAEFRALTGLNRVLLYSFDSNGDGTVLAEDNDGELPSYLGLRFPASDIPPQARDLYTLNRIRLIADSSYVPVPVEPATSPVDGQPLDLSNAALRSVSPVHLEYMRNMGTGASMSISIVVDGGLWGLISCHGRHARHIDAQVRMACDILGQVVSLHIGSFQQARRTAEQLQLKRQEAELLARLADSRSFQDSLYENADLWMALTRASGAAVITGGDVLSTGGVPPEGAIRRVASWLHEGGHEVFATVSLAEVDHEASSYASAASGMIAVSISQIHPDYIMWFRPEAIRVVEWSGNPAKPLDASAIRLSPRTSFELWKEQVRLQCTPWTEAEVESARGFRTSIQNLVLRRAEERADMTERLQRANKELEAFSYSISHDLRAPFRHIVGYSELLADRLRSLDDTSRHYLETIKDSAIAAGRLVDDLLHFSQLGRTPLAYSRVDMRKLLAEVQRSLEPDSRGRNVVWTIGELPPAWGDPSLVRQVLQNLLQNALKYTRPRSEAEITISGRDLGDQVAYTVADNGVGFEMAYVGKLFGVFQRLHRAEEFEGTGIGLALAKRIVDRHGGNIEAQGNPGVGAAFTFTLPAKSGADGAKSRG